MQTVYKSSGRELPQSLLDSDDWQALNQPQRENFRARINYIEEICSKSNDWISARKPYCSHKEYIDNIELDLMTNLQFWDEANNISPWLVHSSWTYGMSPQDLLESLPQEVVNDLSVTEIRFHCSEAEFSSWLTGRIEMLSRLLDGFFTATSFEAVVANLIAIDIALCSFLQGISSQRMNNRISLR